MFDEMVVSTSNRKKTHTRWTIIVSIVGQVGILAVLILIPLIYTQALPTAMMATMLVAPPPPPPPPPPAPKHVVIVKPPPSFIQHNQMVAPKVIPKTITIVKEQQTPNMSSGIYGGVAGGSASAMAGILGSSGAAPPPPPKPVVPSIIHVGGNVQAAKLVRQVMPVYPAIAKAARIQGTVVLHAVIAKDGTIEQLQFVSGPPLLVQAAMNAVREWRYQPTLLNGQPVEVDTIISVVFTLGG